ncbi:MAG: DUF1592 domain-containing protein [Pirellulaceae bacterium]
MIDKKAGPPVATLLLGVVVWLGVTSLSWAQPGQTENELSWDRSIRPLVGRFCLRCHNDDQTRGDINLSSDENPLQIKASREKWTRALEALRDEAMPPDDAPLPSSEERDLLVRFLEETLERIDCDATTDPGRPVVRRLNRTEYDLTILDLTGLDLGLAKDFPPDPSGYGFDNIGDVLTLSPVQVEQYDSAARKIIDVLLLGSPDSEADDPAAQAAFLAIFAPALDDQGNWSLDEPRAAAREILNRFAERAFRRPIDDTYVDRLLMIYDRAREQQASFQAAVGYGLRAVLISPRFLMRVEQTQPDTTEPYLVDAYDLANRLSYFLWSRPPDRELLERAADGSLLEVEVLRAQATRMLRDPRSEAFVESFFGQWLELRGLDTHRPDPTSFPEFTDQLREAMRGEALAVLREMVRDDRSIMTIIDADFTYVDQSLAALYELDGEFGETLQRVTLDDRRRGGLLTSAALLMIQSDPQRVNVPRRGTFIAGRVLGSPPPPPPPNVPSLEESAGNAGELTLRERLELHRSKPECMGCHAKIDPLGFALQNYDAIGRWRNEEASQPIDASGVLPDGREFSGPAEFKDLMLAEREAFARTMSENLLIYALGRGLQGPDQCVVDDMVNANLAADGKFSTLIEEIVVSLPFRFRRNPLD